MDKIILDTKTNTVSTNDWLQATKHMVIFAHSNLATEKGSQTFKTSNLPDVLGKASRRIKK